ncbi:uncharacterized protein LOC144438573 [Glandiceps talaboti]
MHRLLTFVKTVLIFTFAAILKTTLSCSLSSWDYQPFLRRASQAEIIAYGEVTDLFPIAHVPESWPGAYDVKFEVYCVMKGGELENNVYIHNVGELTSCSRTMVQNGTKYVFFLTWEGDKLVPDEVNVQSAADNSESTVCCGDTGDSNEIDSCASCNFTSDPMHTQDQSCYLYSGTSSPFHQSSRLYLFVLSIITLLINVLSPSRHT